MSHIKSLPNTSFLTQTHW